MIIYEIFGINLASIESTTLPHFFFINPLVGGVPTCRDKTGSPIFERGESNNRLFLHPYL